MAFTAKDVLWAVQTTLQDASNRKWTLEELRVYLNDGLMEIAALKPSAVSSSERIDLATGTYQVLPDGQHLMSVIRNITSADNAPTRVAGKVVTPIDRAILDAQFSNWHDTNVVPFASVVTHVCMDAHNPRVFYVFPGNDGTGAIEAIISTVPDAVAAPANPLDLDAYSAEIDLPSLYQNPLRDYVLSRAYEKDAAIPGAPQRAMAYRQSFMNALGVKRQVEDAENLNTDG